MRISKIVILGLTILFISTMTISAEPNLLDSTANIAINNDIVLTYTTHSTVWIEDNSDFVTQGWTGFGNSSHPYTFSGYNITTDASCMYIRNTTAYFEVSDCLFDSISGREGNGINIYNVSNGLITNNTFRSKFLGLDIRWSNSTNVTENIFEDCDYGFLNRHYSFHNIYHNNTLSDITYAIYIYQDYNTTVTFNNVTSCSYGVYAREGFDDYFVNNSILDCTSYGIYTLDSETITLENNSITNSGTGVYLRSSLSCNLTNNIFTDNGMFIASDTDNVLHWNHTVNDNLVNGKTLGYFWNETMQDYSGSAYGQIILANCSNVNVDGGIFHDSTYGVLIGYGYKCSISESAIYGNRYGIYVIRSLNTTLDNNEVYDSAYSGISIRLSNYSIVSNVNVHDNGYDGIQVYSGFWNTIRDSMTYDNGQYGITLDNIPGFYDSAHNIIYNNTIGWNSNNAHDSSGESWFDDLGRGNAWSNYNGVGDYNVPPSGSADHYPSKALYIEDLSNVTIAAGTIGNELNWSATADRPQVYEIFQDDVSIDADMWNGSSLRFSLDDLSAGIYNLTIFVNHSTGHSVTDLVWVHVIDDTTSPITDEPEDFTILYGDLGEEVSWIGIDETPDTYIVYCNNSVFQTDSWINNSEISVSLNGFDIGTYNMTIILFDLAGLNVSDTVWVTVQVSASWPDDELPIINEPADIVYSEGTTGLSITWTPEDEFPSSYAVSRNGDIIIFGDWNSSSESIVIFIDGLLFGTYNFTLLVRDVAGNEAVDTVFVTVVDDTSPILNHPFDISYSEGETGSSITWTPTDGHPDYYEIYRNGSLISTVDWTTDSNIIIAVDGLSAGIWNHTIIVFDESGNSAVDTVMVNVLEVSTTPTDTTPTDTTPTGTDSTNTTPTEVDPEFIQIMMITVTIGSLVVVIVFVILIFRSRK